MTFAELWKQHMVENPDMATTEIHDFMYNAYTEGYIKGHATPRDDMS